MYREQLSVWRQPLARARRATIFEELTARDEERLQKVQSGQRKKRGVEVAGGLRDQLVEKARTP